MSSKSKEMKLAIKIAGKVDSSLKSALSSAKGGIKGIAKVAATACTAATTAVAGLATAAVNVGKEFESSMSQVYATMGIDKASTEGQQAMETLEAAAKEMGATTAFSASEAAEGLNYLALAGYSADEAATALPYTLKLAGAGAMELADASDMVTDAMSALNLEATEQNLSAFSDQLAKSATETNTSVSQLGEAILTVGGTAANLAGGTAELNTALGILATSGIKGAEGGTHLRNMLLSLQSPTDEAAKQLDKLGVSVYDAQGNMRSINDIFVDLQNGMKGMTQEEQDSVFAAIFNKRDLASARAMMSSCGDTFEELEKTIADSAGACDQMYSTQLDNLEGDISIFKSALAGLGIEISQNIGGGVRDAVQLGTECLNDLNEAFQEGGLSGMIGAVGGVLSKLVDYIADIGPGLVDAAINLIDSFVTGLRSSSDKIADSVMTIISKLIDGITNIGPEINFLICDLLISAISSLSAELPGLVTTLISGINTLYSGLIGMLPDLLEVGIELLSAIVEGIIQAIPQLATTASALISQLCSFVNTNLPAFLQVAISLVSELIYGIMQALPQLIQSGMQIINTLVSCILQNLPIILSAGIELLYAIINGLMNNLDQLMAAAITLIMELVAGLLQNLPMLISCAIELIVALAAGLIQAIPQLLAAIPQLVTAIVNGFAETDWASIGKDIIQGIIDGFLGMWNSLKETATNIRNSIKSIFSKKVETNVSVKSSAKGAAHAAGGIFTKPTVLQSVNNANHLVGEAGPEAILPLNSLWSNMSTMLDPQFANVNAKLSTLAESVVDRNGSGGNSDIDNSDVINYSPTIIIQGNADKDDVEKATKMSFEEFKKLYRQMKKEEQRVRF